MFRRPRLFALAASLLLAVGALVWYRAEPSPETLIAKAYNARRTTELRIPGVEPVRLYSPTRGDQISPEWPELLRAKLRAQEALQTEPENAYWHQILGRVFILQSEPESALSEFQLANSKAPNLKRIQFDLGTAYFELGEQSRNPSDYGFAAEAFSHSLEIDRDDASALVDRALCWQRIGIKQLALEDLNKALKEEKNADWRKAIQTLIDESNRLRDDPKGVGSPLSESSPDPIDWDQPHSDNYEEDLEGVIRNSIDPLVPQNLLRIQRIADVGMRHNDPWLADWLRTAQARSSNKANSLLAAAVRNNSNGRAEQALLLASDSRRLYSLDGNRAGEARAWLEQVYALQRMGRDGDCLNELHDSSLNKIVSRYSSLRTRLLLEKGACLYSSDASATSLEAIKLAMQGAASARLPILYERAQGFLAAYYTQRGMTEAGWRADIDGLRFCGRMHCPPLREYQFLADLIDDSAALGLERLSVAFASLSSDRASDASNLQLEAYSREVLGQRYLDIGDVEEAKRAFVKADQSLSLIGDNRAIRTYRADWVADRSQLLALEGRQDLALTNLRLASSEIQATQSLMIQINYWSKRALLEDESRRADESIISVKNAILYGGKVLANIRKSSDRRAWQANMKVAYLTLVDALLGLGKNEQAFMAWEDFRSISDSTAVQTLPLDSFDRIPATWNISDQDTLVYARLNHKYVRFAMLAGERNVSVIELPIDPDALDQLVRTFSLLCSDPRSQISEIRMLGAQLYRILFADVENVTGRNLRIEAGPVLEKLPFSALTTPRGEFLAETVSISLLPEFWTLHPRAESWTASPSAAVLILRPVYSTLRSPRIPENYDETTELIKRFPRAKVDDGTESRSDIIRHIANTEVFHFIGHASGDDQSSQLIVDDVSDREVTALSADSLEKINLPRCRLVVLAACSTAEGRSRALQLSFDLPDAFLKAGAIKVVATLWPVDSVATKELTLAFYDELLKGKSPSMALFRSEALMRRRVGFEHPYYWSGFGIFGT